MTDMNRVSFPVFWHKGETESMMALTSMLTCIMNSDRPYVMRTRGQGEERPGILPEFAEYRNSEDLASPEEIYRLVALARNTRAFPFITRIPGDDSVPVFAVTWMENDRWRNMYVRAESKNAVLFAVHDGWVSYKSPILSGWHDMLVGRMDALETPRDILRDEGYMSLAEQIMDGAVNSIMFARDVPCALADAEPVHSVLVDRDGTSAEVVYCSDSWYEGLLTVCRSVGGVEIAETGETDGTGGRGVVVRELTDTEINGVIAGVMLAGDEGHEPRGAGNTRQTPPLETERTREPETLRGNPPVVLSEGITARFSDAVWLKAVNDAEIIIAGIGGIGSWVSLLVGRMHPRRMYLVDPDRVEQVNMGGQLYGDNDIGMDKVTAAQNMLSMYAGYYAANGIARRIEPGDDYVSEIMICGFDSMEARKTFFNNWKKFVESHDDPKACLFIDGRMSAEQFQIFCIKGNERGYMEFYEREKLFSDDKAESETCSFRQTSFCASLIAGHIVNLLVNFMANRSDPSFTRPVPFFTFYDAECMHLKTEGE